MRRNNLYIFIAASLALLVPSPGRLACGIILLLALNFTMFLGTFFRKLIGILKMNDLLGVLMAMFLICITVIIKQLLTLFSPILALMLSFVLYIPALSSFLIGYFFEYSKKPLKEELKDNMSETFRFSVYAIILFALRDAFGYGTLTLPAANGFLEFYLPGRYLLLQMGDFLASTPGALVLVGLLLALQAHIVRRISVVENAFESSLYDKKNVNNPKTVKKGVVENDK